MTKNEEKAINNFIKLMLNVTFRICHLDENGDLKTRSSGFLYQKNVNSPILVITAGHDTIEEGSFIETSHILENGTIAINAGKFNIFYKENTIDYAYSELPMELINESLKGIQLSLKVYRESFDKAVETKEYGFAVANNYEFVSSGEDIIMPRYLCQEISLKLVRQDEHFNYFKTVQPLQDDEYYRGASGSPVADSTGRICSILVSGTKPREFLKAFRLDNIEFP